MASSSQIGYLGEELAVKYLQSLNYKILFRNVHSIFGEIDIVAFEKGVLVFVEVKKRSSLKYGYPEESIGKNKIKKIIKTIDWFFLKYPKLKNTKYRIDAVAILSQKEKNTLKHFKNLNLF